MSAIVRCAPRSTASRTVRLWDMVGSRVRCAGMSSSAPESRLPSIVTLAALHGTEGNVIGPRVAERLGVAFLDRPIPHTVAEDAGVSEQAIAETDESPRSRWDRVVDTLARGSPPTGASPAPEQVDLHQRRLQAEIEEFLA